jgi:catechol 2,3-dioxygenase-like lactoylglutathione lyase family enzyme
MTKPTKFAHVVYRSRRFEQMLQWYETVFGARVQYRDPGLAFLTYDDEHHRFAFVNMGVFQPDGVETERQGAIGVDHVDYTYMSLRELLETYARLKEQGIIPYWRIHHGITASLYYADPDGNQMEFQVESFPSSGEANAFIQAHWGANPLGVEFDPEDWLSKLRAGTLESNLLLRKVHEPVSPLRGEITKFVSTG